MTATATSHASTAAAHLHLRADGVSFSYPDRRVLTDVSLVVPAGRPTGLLGENGCGKTTLLRILAGELEADGGTLDLPGPVGLLHQELPRPADWTLQRLLEDALSRARRLEAELAAAAEALADAPEDPQAARRYDELLEEATLADVWTAEHRAEEVLAGLALADLPRERILGEISGGQRARPALAHLLISRPPTPLLDEPTNHLDDAGAAFLARLLAEHPGPVLLASHDRAFLDEATLAQIDLDPAPTPLHREPGGARAYTGTFSDYLMARFDERDRWEQQFAREQDELNELRAIEVAAHRQGRISEKHSEIRGARKFYSDKAAVRVARSVREATQRLERLEREQIRKPPADLHFTAMPAAPRKGTGQVLISAVEVGVDGRLAPTSLALTNGEHLLVTGVNGSGKSTLLDVLVGRLEPSSGTVNRPANLRIGHLLQDDEAPADITVGEHLRRATGIEDEAAVPELFGLVHPRDLTRPLTVLSRGQLRRVMLAAILLDPPDLLVLDEPTNHLALVTATRLEAALADWPGTVLIASHDRWLRRRWTGRTLALAPMQEEVSPDE
ncbi:ABC-F family ATP-binding cassette domain-containing protein [Brachybacterium timonense]|uniref:ABC-F family ATP-binding cassette domain-containing protein n=1 Tax=Brachybacterium timonense TaxID=2050896 RepID=UPI000D0B5FE5|nr:ATP-binding cassette domain-containing protein [Brachybacterium timonense]